MPNGAGGAGGMGGPFGGPRNLADIIMGKIAEKEAAERDGKTVDGEFLNLTV